MTFYDYTDKDFCFFSDFPHQKLIVPILKPIYKSSCSCTELFLIRHSYLLKDDILFYLDQTVSDYYELSQFYREEINEREKLFSLLPVEIQVLIDIILNN